MDTKKLELEDKPKVVPVRSMKQHTPPCFTPGDALKESFKGDTKALEKEFYKQLKAQEAGLNKMTVGRYLENRNILNALTKEHGHKKARAIITKGGVEQAKARAELKDKIQDSIFKSLKRNGKKNRQAEMLAEKLAQEQLAELAALHDPDLIAGGDDTIRKLGNKNVNASLGSQWGKGKRVESMDDAAKHAATKFGPETKMNINLERCR